MSEKEKTILEKMAQLPTELQDKMAAQIDGAVMVLDMLGKGNKVRKDVYGVSYCDVAREEAELDRH